MIVNRWVDFIKHLCWVCRELIERNEHYNADEKEILYRILKGLEKDLTRKDLLQVVADNCLDMGKDDLDNRAIIYLDQEMEFFNSRINRLITIKAQQPQGPFVSNEDLQDGANSGEAIKGSGEKLLKFLPGWAKKLLKILNEIIKIAMGTVA